MDIIDAGVNLVEIDLISQGSYVLAAPLEELQLFDRLVFNLCLSRRKARSVRSLPSAFGTAPAECPVPLRYGEHNAVLQLQPLLDQCYQDGHISVSTTAASLAASSTKHSCSGSTSVCKAKDVGQRSMLHRRCGSTPFQ